MTTAVNVAFAYNSGEITLKWDNNSGSGSAKATAKSMYVVLNPSKSDAVFETAVSDRTVKTQVADFSAEWIGDRV